jgi:hypothetical protein
MNTGDLQYCGGDLYVSGSIQAGGTIGGTSSGGAEPEIIYDGTPAGILAQLVTGIQGGISSLTPLTVGKRLQRIQGGPFVPIKPLLPGHLYTFSGCLSFRFALGPLRTITAESFPEITLYIGDRELPLQTGYLSPNYNSYCIANLSAEVLQAYCGISEVTVTADTATPPVYTAGVQYKKTAFFTIPFTTTLQVDTTLPDGVVPVLSVDCVYTAAVGGGPLTWSATAEYFPGDVARYDATANSWAYCKNRVAPAAANPTPPNDLTKWDLVVPWNGDGSVSYVPEDVVTDPASQTLAYRCLVAYTPTESSLSPNSDTVHWVKAINGVGFDLEITSGALYETNLHMIDYGVPAQSPPSQPVSRAAPAASKSAAPPLVSKRVLPSSSQPVFSAKPPLTAAQRAKAGLSLKRAATAKVSAPVVAVKSRVLTSTPVFAAAGKQALPVAQKKPVVK